MDEEDIEYSYKTVITVKDERGIILDIIEQSEGAPYSVVGFLADQIGQRLLRDGRASIEVRLLSFVSDQGR